MPKCSVKKCKNNTLTTLKKDGISYFRFPKNEIEREKWRKIIANERSEDFFKPNDSSVICSCHFSENDMYYTKKGFRKIKKGVLPCIAIEISTTQFQNVSPGSSRNEPSTNRVGDNLEIEISTTQFQNISPGSARNEPSTNRIDDDSEENNKMEAIPQNEQITELDLIHPCPPSPISSGLTSILDTPKTSYYKNHSEYTKKPLI